MEKEKKRKSLIIAVLRMSVIPLIGLGIVLTVYSQNSVREGMSFEVEKSLSGLAHSLISTYNMMDAGEFSYEDGRVMKGNTELTSDYRLLDDMKNDTGADVTIFIGNERCLTTLVDESGKRLIGTKASPGVIERVLNQGEEYFSEQADVNGVPYFGYYVPITNDEGDTIGMSFAGEPKDSVNSSIRFMVEGNVIICIFAILLAGFICNMLARRMVSAISCIKQFLGRLAHGDFSQKMPEEVLERRDQLADMGEYAVSVSHSLKDMVEKDPLTGLLNRRAFLKKVEKRQESGPFVVAMGDIDFFKRVNDQYGHKMGDEVLRHVAGCLEEIAEGEEGFVSRWGGEEFLIGFQGSLPDLEERLNKVSKCISDAEFETDDRKFTISMTFGVAVYQEGETIDELVRRADILLYQGKEDGRNCIVLEPVVR
ncbi:MAG: diguanylate cyclase [Lachnospiraceae bacterium]|nr:diguanylate cyclase [Lachnospiraceae bacterium]